METSSKLKQRSTWNLLWLKDNRASRQTHGFSKLSSYPLAGMVLASAILALWTISLGCLLCLDKSQLSSIWILPFVFGRTFIQTGLFIVAHDAIHESVSSRYLWLNHGLGRLASTLYALLSYQQLSCKHWQHHQYPGQVNDPDFHDGIHQNVFAWYLKFMRRYLDLRQSFYTSLGVGIIFVIFHFGFHISIANLFLYWLLPILLSSIQLFFFGTYLPHRPNTTATADCIVSSRFPVLLSLLSCYHFGYHWEHHEYPKVPWYQLPSMRQNHSSE